MEGLDYRDIVTEWELPAGTDIGGPKVEEAAPLARILRARDLPGRRVDNRNLPISDEAAFRPLGSVRLLPIIDFTG
jgi:hypothetical protein